jgi:hypothetical protein
LDGLVLMISILFLSVTFLIPGLVYLFSIEIADRIYMKRYDEILFMEIKHQDGIVLSKEQPGLIILNGPLYSTFRRIMGVVSVIFFILLMVVMYYSISSPDDNLYSFLSIFYSLFIYCLITLIYIIYRIFSKLNFNHRSLINKSLYKYRIVGFAVGILINFVLFVFWYFINCFTFLRYIESFDRFYPFGNIYLWTIIFPGILYIFSIEIADRIYVKRFNEKINLNP